MPPALFGPIERAKSSAPLTFFGRNINDNGHIIETFITFIAKAQKIVRFLLSVSPLSHNIVHKAEDHDMP
jgi:hypothetical protein